MLAVVIVMVVVVKAVSASSVQLGTDIIFNQLKLEVHKKCHANFSAISNTYNVLMIMMQSL
jgi:hypothetical protein